MTPKSEIYNTDCLEYMRTLPDKAFDLCLADPPYGIDINSSGHLVREKGWEYKTWDKDAPSKEWFKELRRVSKHCIIWGANHFIDRVPINSKAWVVWDKRQPENFSFAMCELALTDFEDKTAKIFRYSPSQQSVTETRIHPCLPKGQKVFINGEWMGIENVKIGDTSNYGEVVAITTHKANRLVEIEADGESVLCTWNHPFLVMRESEIAWVQAEQIQKNDYILWNKSIKRNTNLQRKDIFVQGDKTALKWSMCEFGRVFSGKFQKVTKSIISMVTRKTIVLKTYSLSQPLNISGYTKVASLSSILGISRVRYVVNIKDATKRTGIIPEALSMVRFVKSAISKKHANSVRFERVKVGSVKNIEKEETVYNLTISGTPAFDTVVGCSHNTQKPVALYAWLLKNYAKEGDTIFDPMAGSQASRIAAYKMGFDYVGCELDKEYFEKGCERFNRECKGILKLQNGKTAIEQTLF